MTSIPGFKGALIGPGDKGYDAARAIWNAMHDRRPALIAQPRSAQDVAVAIGYARANHLVIAVRGGGHSMPGHSVCDGGLVIDLRALSHVHVDPRNKKATVGGGALLCEVDRATQQHGLVVPAGVVSHTGVGGLTLGGGVGRLMRRFGLTIDSLRAALVVAADGQILRASADEHPDLFWALRGGGGNFGVVTEFEFTLHQLSELTILAMFHPLEQARQVIERARREMADPAARDELLWTSFLRRASDVPWIPPALKGQHGIMSLVEWSGDPEEGRTPLAKIKEEVEPAASDLSVVPFLFRQTVTDDLFASGLRTYIKAGFAEDLPDALIGTLLDRAAVLQSPISQVELLALGGAIARVEPNATAFPFRQSRWLINIPATWRDAADDEREIAWARATFAAVKPFLTGGTYVNFMGDDEEGGATSAYGRTVERLEQVKAAYDPDNVFRRNQNIAPVTAAAQVQRRLWGTDPQAWADLAEAHNQPLFEVVLDAAAITKGARLLDVGCGSGLTLMLAEARGAITAGLDISPGLLQIARDRLPRADLREADMESLPFADAAFDAVTGVNAFQFAGDPQRALREAARVTRPGGHVVASLFAAPERSQGTVVHEAMSALIPPEQAADHAPYALSAPGNLEKALAGAGLHVADSGEVVCHWRYETMDDAVHALLCSAGGARAVQAAGETEVRDVLQHALAQFRDPSTGAVTLVNTFRWVAARRPSALGPAGQHDLLRPLPRPVRSAGLVRLQPDRLADQGSQLRQRPAGRAQRPGLGQDVAPAGRLDRPGHHRELAGVRDQLAEQRIGHATPNHVHGPRRPAGQPDRIVDRLPDRHGHAVQDAAQDLRPARQRRTAHPLAGIRDPPGHPAGRQEHRILHVDQRPRPRDPPGREGERFQVDLPPLPDALLQQPEPGHVAQEPGGPVHAGLIAEPGPAGRLGDHRRRQFHPDQRPRPGADEREALVRGGHPGHRGGRVVRRPDDHLRRARQTQVRDGGPGHLACRPQQGKHFYRNGQRVSHLVSPGHNPGVEQSRGRGVGQLGAQLPGQPVGHEVGDQHDVPGPVQVALGHQLEHRVDRLRGDPGRLVQARRVDAAHAGAADRGERRAGPRVPVAGRVGDQLAVAVQQPVVHRPPVDANGIDVPGRTQPVEDPGEQRAGVPAQHAAHGPGLVREPVHLAEAETPARSVSKDNPPAGGT